MRSPAPKKVARKGEEARVKRSLATAVLLVTLMAGGCRHDKPDITYRIVLPDNYVGWVRVDFAGSMPTLDADNRITLRVKEDGTCLSGSSMIIGTPTSYEFLYDTTDGLRPVRDDYVDHSLQAGGMTARSDSPGSSGIYGLSWFFFVGPKGYRDQHPNKQFTYDNLPKPGRMKL